MNWRDNPYFPQVLENSGWRTLKSVLRAMTTFGEGNFLTFHDGAYYSVEMRDANAEGRITSVPYERAAPVITAWDLGGWR